MSHRENKGDVNYVPTSGNSRSCVDNQSTLRTIIGILSSTSSAKSVDENTEH